MPEWDEAAVIELRKITRLLVLSLTKDHQQIANIAMLSKVGFGPRDIADLLGTTPNTVSVALSQMRNKGKLSATRRTQKQKGSYDDQQGTAPSPT